MDIERYFKNKRITVMGLGLLGRGIGVVRFLANQGARLVVSDLKNEKDLRPALQRLRRIRNIEFILGKHRLKDFRNKDMVIKAAGVPLDSEYIKKAKDRGIPVEMDASLFAKLSPGTTIGITGTRGKSTVTRLIYEVLRLAVRERSFPKRKKPGVYLGGNVKGRATLPLLLKAKKDDLVVLELDSWQLQGFGEAKISPHIAVFTNFLEDHQNYYKGNMKRYFRDKENIFRYQTGNDFLILTKQSLGAIRELSRPGPRAKKKIVFPGYLPRSWKLKLPGDHNRQNAALALAVADVLGIGREVSKKAIESFDGIEGRLEVARKVRGITFINDTTATVPDAVIAALDSLKGKRINLIAGGSDKGLDYRKMVKSLRRGVNNVIFLPGSATEKIISLLPPKPPFGLYRAKGMREAVNLAWRLSRKGDFILLSPGAASFGIFRNEFDRGTRFNNAVKKLD